MNHTTELVMEEHHDALGARVGMWIFLLTEILLFGGLFLVYAIYRSEYPQDFHVGSGELDQFIGAVNTIILLTSSLTMVLSVGSLQRKNKKPAVLFLILTMVLGGIFLINKYFEWGLKISHGLYPNSPELLQRSKGEILFYSLYFVMTGLHGLHVIVGMVIMGFLLYFINKKSHKALTLPTGVLKRYAGKKLQLADQTGQKIWESEKIDDKTTGLEVVVRRELRQEDVELNMIKFENTGLYWHLVDIIWIFLFPLFYLIGM